MRSRFPSRVRLLTALTQTAARLVVGVMLILFPATKAHDFGTHFRNPEVRRSVERHTFVAHSHDNTRERMAQNNLRTASFAPIETDRQIALLENFDAVPRVPISYLLNRLKLHPARSDRQDPLL